jgi:hypothetical protein
MPRTQASVRRMALGHSGERARTEAEKAASRQGGDLRNPITSDLNTNLNASSLNANHAIPSQYLL